MSGQDVKTAPTLAKVHALIRVRIRAKTAAVERVRLDARKHVRIHVKLIVIRIVLWDVAAAVRVHVVATAQIHVVAIVPELQDSKMKYEQVRDKKTIFQKVCNESTSRTCIVSHSMLKSASEK